MFLVSFIFVFIPPLPEGGGVYSFTSVRLSFRPSNIFFVAFFSVTVDGRNLIFGHTLHRGMPYCGKRFWTHQIPTSCLSTQLFFLFISYRLFIIGYFVSHVLLFSFHSIYIQIFFVYYTRCIDTPFIRDIHYYIFKYLFDNQLQVLFINLINRLLKDEVLLTVSSPIFPSILIAKNLLTGSLQNRSIDNLETQKKSISMKNSQFFDYLIYAKSK